MGKIIERNKIAFATYFKNADESKCEELGPFILENHLIECDKAQCIWNVYQNLFDNNLISIVDHEGKQNQSFTTTQFTGIFSGIQSIDSSSNITLNKIMFSTEVILKMPAEKRLELLQKDYLDVKDILEIYDFICENKETLRFENLENQNQHKKIR